MLSGHTSTFRKKIRWYGFVEFFSDDAMHLKYFPDIELLFEYARDEKDPRSNRDLLLDRRSLLLEEVARVDALLREEEGS